jgi:hypothetical protein
MEFEIVEGIDSCLWECDHREKARTRQVDGQDMSRKALEIPESEEL